jgi:pyruvate dehydrogenase E2 component (dihydrolipoamide acetyltransferase)
MSVNNDETRISDQGVPIIETIPMVGMKKMIADHMTDSHLTSPPVTILEEIGVEGLVKLKNKLSQDPNRTDNVKISYTHLLIKAVSQALGQNRMLNSTLANKEVQILGDINIGMATALPDGNLIVPVIHQADKINIVEIARKAADLMSKAKRGQLTIKDVRGGTFTLTNIGIIPESRWHTPIINQPQCAILGTGAVRQTPAISKDQIIIHWVLSVSLTFDHRIISGVPAALFIKTLSEILADPCKLQLGL